ncbi:hypothetical protein E2C01_082305 [Portunus trituberculatus]|uniref:Uncharacterized protein n=1 Tax=Portunus trituberculatus TaxID=210409 RepID=A0A5B7IYV3_PORTR|nr:hypothetical protein [Portunus trituberculatus]
MSSIIGRQWCTNKYDKEIRKRMLRGIACSRYRNSPQRFRCHASAKQHVPDRRRSFVWKQSHTQTTLYRCLIRLCMGCASLR